MLITVDKNNQITGFDSWQTCHSLKPKLHRGFTVLVFNYKKQLLIAKRSDKKPLWPGFWDGVSSHPKKNETGLKTAERRLAEEMGFTCRLKKMGRFTYKAKYQNLGYEWEICTVWQGKYNGSVCPVKSEVSDYQWIGIKDLAKEINNKTKEFAPWFIKISRQLL